MSYYDDEYYNFIQFLGNEELESILNNTFRSRSRYRDLDPNKVKELAEKELQRRRDKKREEQADLLVGLADIRSEHLLSILENIARSIERKPKQTIAIIVLVPVAIAVLTNLLSFIGKELWINLFIPLLKNIGVSIK